MSRWAEVASLVLAASASVFLLLTSTYWTETAIFVHGESVGSREQQTLLAAGGVIAVLGLAIPVALAALPMVVRRRGARILSACLLWTFSLAGSASIGLAFVPSALAMLIAAAVPRRGKRVSANWTRAVNSVIAASIR